jgi:transcriptional regulator GlxA family with amidase domain
MADVFEEFVAVVAEGMAGPGTAVVNGAGLAGRVHLSRFHFDRVIGAVAGESPFAFQRRVLLERAAYRLLAEQIAVLDVAVEAGYGSSCVSGTRSPAPASLPWSTS